MPKEISHTDTGSKKENKMLILREFFFLFFFLQKHKTEMGTYI